MNCYHKHYWWVWNPLEKLQSFGNVAEANQILSQISPCLLRHDTLFFFLSGLSRTPPEKLSDLLENTGLFDNRLWMVSEELAITICGHSTDNCYYCLSHKKKGIRIQELPLLPFLKYFLSYYCLRRWSCSHIGKLQTP